MTDAIGRTYTFASEQAGAVEVRLIAAPAGTPMDDEFLCYSAHFELPVGVRLPQDTYRVSDADGTGWDLFATPTRPTAQGAGTMCVVIHRAKDQQAAQQPQGGASPDTPTPGPA
ncbi:DUF6916 family protein [Paraburkholderia sp. BCC1885]|uniref:DUF6916 family protein n=1 Tax=Paraburkholderia sp. BCC1885 TaxID=2562669 RepID=UPI0021B3AAC0|nr:hypothetical protein [Paraburkholderia sp. BCC1885]